MGRLPIRFRPGRSERAGLLGGLTPADISGKVEPLKRARAGRIFLAPTFR